jgi:hypothetical protein
LCHNTIRARVATVAATAALLVNVRGRTLNVADALRRCGSTGDRAVILAPQGLDYIVAFLGAFP